VQSGEPSEAALPRTAESADYFQHHLQQYEINNTRLMSLGYNMILE